MELRRRGLQTKRDNDRQAECRKRRWRKSTTNKKQGISEPEDTVRYFAKGVNTAAASCSKMCKTEADAAKDSINRLGSSISGNRTSGRGGERESMMKGKEETKMRRFSKLCSINGCGSGSPNL
jgi:hypothetical protein